MENTVTIKFGQFEVSCTGSETFIENGFPAALQAAKDVFLELGVPVMSGTMAALGDPSDTSKPDTSSKTPLSISTICAKLKVESGPDLIMAACFSLARQGKPSASRKQISLEMKSATSYFKANYISNMSASLKNLITSNKLLEQAKDVFAVDAATMAAMESQLGIS